MIHSIPTMLLIPYIFVINCPVGLLRECDWLLTQRIRRNAKFYRLASSGLPPHIGSLIIIEQLDLYDNEKKLVVWAAKSFALFYCPILLHSSNKHPAT